MQEFWAAYSMLQKVLFVIAVPATLILAVQFILLLFGLGDQNDVDVDGDFVSDSGADLPDSDMGPDGELSDGGMDADGADVDSTDSAGHEALHDPGLRIFTVRGVLTFCAVSGWAGLVMSYTALPAAATVLIAALLGVGSMVLMALMVKAMLKLQYIPSVSMNSLIGQTAQVYITIPAANSGAGKIMAEFGGRLSEVEAVTYGKEAIKTGSNVLVSDLNGRTAVVERL